MKEVWINHKQVDFGNAKTQQKVQPGCGIIEDKFDDELQVGSPSSACVQKAFILTVVFYIGR